jgi:D-erythritol 1-phosphate dehydrogenase
MRDLGNFDLITIGGGINGVGIARDAAGRGLKVLLCEKDDLAQGTSSRSGKYIHGGLRYLEYYEFRLVREALNEREVLLNAAPHIIWPMRLVLPHSPEQRPAWFIRLGLFLYDHLGGRKQLPGCRRINLRADPEGDAIRNEFKLAFEYSDCWVDDARLVTLNAVDAAERGATILTRTAATSARRIDDAWHVELKSKDGERMTARAKVIANAAGPWVEKVINGVLSQNSQRHIRLVKGSHIITRKFWKGDHAYVFQNKDKRIIFINPYMGDMALIGTTDIPFEGRAEDVAIDDNEIDYLLASVNRYAKSELKRADIITAYSGVRPLYDDKSANPSAVTRDYVFETDGSPPVLSVFGGKITTYRKLAEHALRDLKKFFPDMGADWTAHAHLPGGDLPGGDFERYVALVSQQFPWMPAQLVRDYARRYGTRMVKLVGDAKSLRDLGQNFGGNLYEAEVRYLKENEWAQAAEDIIFRRTKAGLRMNDQQKEKLQNYFGTV